MRPPRWTLLLVIIGIAILSALALISATAVQQVLESLKPGFNNTQATHPP